MERRSRNTLLLLLTVSIGFRRTLKQLGDNKTASTMNLE